jgi:hypothetical protein
MIDLSTPLSLTSSFRFPLQSPESRREVAWGAVLLVLLPGIGWFLNMGTASSSGTACSTASRRGRPGRITPSSSGTA